MSPRGQSELTEAQGVAVVRAWGTLLEAEVSQEQLLTSRGGEGAHQGEDTAALKVQMVWGGEGPLVATAALCP